MPFIAFADKINQLFFYLIKIQIFLSVAKFIIVGPMESIVGSMSFSGGAYATTFPILGFVFLWMYRKGNFSIKDWALIAGLMFMGFINYKRAIWFMMPVVIGLFMFYVQRRKISNRMKGLALVIIPLIFYLGVRLNPTLNKEQKVWGSFDLNFTQSYVKQYSYGEKGIETENERIQGRGGVATLLFGKLIAGELTKEDWLGNGLTIMYVTGPLDDRSFSERFNINSIGAATGFMQSYVVFGFLGVFVTLMFVFSILIQTKNRRIRYALMAIFCWEYFLYTGSILREPAFSCLIIYLVLYSNQQFGNLPIRVSNDEHSQANGLVTKNVVREYT
jgi:hypothetical protein